MNLSSIIIKTLPEKMDDIIKEMEHRNYCEVHLSESGTVIGVIEADNLDAEMQKFKGIETLNGVLSVELSFAYNEDELEESRNQVGISADFPDWLNNDSIRAGQIKYSGNIKDPS